MNLSPTRIRPKILLIDDEKSFTDMVQINLELKTDYRVFVENNSLEALDTARRVRPHLILLDAIMPGLDGFEVLTRLENDFSTRQIPVIFLSAIAQKLNLSLEVLTEIVQRTTIGKPVKIVGLIAGIERKLAEHQGVR